MRSLTLLAFMLGVASALPSHLLPRQNSSNTRTTAPAGAIIVDGSASPVAGSVKTIKEGVAALSNTSTADQYIFIHPGVYKEQVYIPALASALTVQGYTTDASGYEKNEATISFDLSRNDVANNDLTATLRQWNQNTKFYNLIVENTFGHTNTNGQNLALSANTGNQGYYGMQFLGYQDTILANNGNQLYAKCLITGVVDFIFGQKATAWFEGVDIRTLAKGYITASGRLTADSPSWYVINKSTVAAINSSVPAGSTYLGRPWKAYARVTFQNTQMSDVVADAGWSIWSTAEPNTNTSDLSEFGNSGPGSEGPRADFAKKLTKQLEIADILGSGWQSESWVDTSYM